MNSEALANLHAQILELKQENQELKQENQELHHMESMLEMMPNGYLVIDNRGYVVQSNPAASHLLGVNIEGQLWINVINACFSPQPDDGHEVSLKNGKRVLLSTMAAPNASGQFVFMSDQTQTRNLQAKLYHYQRLSEMGRMLASLAHQIRTPLSAALLYASHLMEAQLDENLRIRFAEKIRRNLLHLEHQVRDMLVFARGETRLDDTLSADMLLTHLSDLLHETLSQYAVVSHFENLAGEVSILCNKEILLGAIINLVNNALQAGGADLTLHVRMQMSPRAGYLDIIVADQGPGMDASLLKQVQEPFFTTKSHGTGLGLSVAQVVAHSHRGFFAIKSQQGVGTQAIFSLPLKE